MPSALPIDDVMAELLGAVKNHGNAVLIAPPGAGKTTRVPWALAQAPFVQGRVLVLEPRRLAARVAARRVAQEQGKRLGAEVGYRVRFDNKSSKDTKVLFLTEGLLTRWMHDDALLEGVGAVMLDEFHERSVHADMALALLREVQATVRPELKLVVASATLDPGPVAKFLGDSPVVESDGRLFPVELHYLEQPDDRRPEQVASRGVKRAVRETKGDILTFLPGVPEIRRTQTELRGLDSVAVLPLYGDLSAKEQDRVLQPGSGRRVILATNVAESSLTIEGITTVVDTGLAKEMRFDPARGLDVLQPTNISRQNADQRSGRAGRLGPGVAYRLWTLKSEQHRVPAPTPELFRIDLSSILLDVLRWSASDPRGFSWFEAPPEANVAVGLQLLERLGAIKGFELTPLGHQLAGWPVHPRPGAMLAFAASHGLAERGALLAALASERDVLAENLPNDLVAESDLLERLNRMEGFRAEGAQAHAARRWGLHTAGALAVDRSARQLERLAKALKVKKQCAPKDEEQLLLRSVLAGYADRVARRAAVGATALRLTSGGRAVQARESVVREGLWMVAVTFGGGAAGKPIVRLASSIEEEWLHSDTSNVRVEDDVAFDSTRERVEARRRTLYLDRELSGQWRGAADSSETARVLEEAARARLDTALPVTPAIERFVARARFLAIHLANADFAPPEYGDRAELLPELCMGRSSFAELRKADLFGTWCRHLSPKLSQRLAVDAPETIKIPSGRQAKLRYENDGPPVVSAQLQELFGLATTPRIAGGRVPVKVEILAPNKRPVQVTQDLESFWKTTYPEIRKELRARYSKHQWPEDPSQGIATTRPRRRKPR